MPIIKLIDRTTDISRLKMRQMDWDTDTSTIVDTRDMTADENAE